MNWMIASDIHGSAKWCRAMLDAFAESGAERLVLLGDILYHGPRNDLPEEYAPKQVIAMLNPMRERLLCVRGNCDTEVDQMVLDFPILADYAAISCGSRLIYATHGHIYSADNLPPLAPGDLLLHGHTHIPGHTEADGHPVLNPGSVSIPKNGTPHSYMLLTDGVFTWYDLSTGRAFDRFAISEKER